jgi:hypothetical protein
MADAPNALSRPAVLVVALQAAAAVAVGAVVLVRASDSFAVATGVMALLAGLALAGCARALRAGGRWPRGPLLTVQLLGLPIGVGLLQAGRVAIGVCVLLVAAATAAMLGAGAS